MSGKRDTAEAVRRHYAAVATAVADGASCCGPDTGSAGTASYGADELDAVPSAASSASLGCGNPTAVANLSPAEVVLDLGSGGGIDVFLSARRVGPAGKVYGLDMTDEMLELARRNAADAGVDNVQFLKGRMEAIPLPDGCVDVVISNCVINLSIDKPTALSEAFRVLRPGGRLAVTDIVADPDMDDATRADMEQWTGCIAGALTRGEYADLLQVAGFTDVEIAETHRVHEHAASAIIRARRPLRSA
jgi:SAM-dependent methyltransferase